MRDMLEVFESAGAEVYFFNSTFVSAIDMLAHTNLLITNGYVSSSGRLMEELQVDGGIVWRPFSPNRNSTTTQLPGRTGVAYVDEASHDFRSALFGLLGLSPSPSPTLRLSPSPSLNAASAKFDVGVASEGHAPDSSNGEATLGVLRVENSWGLSAAHQTLALGIVVIFTGLGAAWWQWQLVPPPPPPGI